MRRPAVVSAPAMFRQAYAGPATMCAGGWGAEAGTNMAGLAEPPDAGGQRAARAA